MSKIEVKVRFADEGGSEHREVTDGIRIGELLEGSGRNPETVVVKRNGMVVPEEEELSDGDELEVIPVVSGG